MIFRINKCAIFIIVKPKKFKFSIHYKNPSFKLGMNHLPSNNQYIYIEMSFYESLNLELIIIMTNSKINL